MFNAFCVPRHNKDKTVSFLRQFYSIINSSILDLMYSSFNLQGLKIADCIIILRYNVKIGPGAGKFLA